MAQYQITVDSKTLYQLFMTKAQELKCSSNCLVPCGVLNVSRIAAGFLAESLCKKVGSLSITFD